MKSFLRVSMALLVVGAASSCSLRPRIQLINRGEAAIERAVVHAGGVEVEFSHIPAGEEESRSFSPIADSTITVEFALRGPSTRHECIGDVYVTNGPARSVFRIEVLPDATCRISVER